MGWDWRGPTVDWATQGQLNRIEQKVDNLMANLQALQAASDQITNDVASAIAALDNLSQRVGSGGDISQADVDAITASLTSAHQQLTDAVAQDNAPAQEQAPAPEQAPVTAPDQAPAAGDGTGDGGDPTPAPAGNDNASGVDFPTGP